MDQHEEIQTDENAGILQALSINDVPLSLGDCVTDTLTGFRGSIVEIAFRHNSEMARVMPKSGNPHKMPAESAIPCIRLRHSTQQEVEADARS